MKQMSVAEAAEFFGVSREAIHNRIRRGSLESVVQDGVKVVLVDEASPTKKTAAKPRAKTTANDERYYKLLEAQNAKLQERVDHLENETRTLRDQKEQMLIEERQKIERIYKEKDEQLKSILQSISSQFMLTNPLSEEPETLEAQTVEIAEIEEPKESKPKKKNTIVSLTKYLKKSGYSKKKIENIKKRFKKYAKKDARITVVGSKYYIDITKYSYDDLIK